MAEYATGDHRTTVLRGVPYGTYARLVRVHENRHLRMTYYDGTLEIASVRLFRHERARIALDTVVRAVVEGLEIPCSGVGSTTLRRAGDGPFKGKGKEPDQAYYLANADHLLGKADLSLDSGDLPPDLWIEVDARSDARGRLPVYAALGVPEVWRYRDRSGRLWFGRLIEGGLYREIDRSLALPVLTPGLVLEALAMRAGHSDSEWTRRLRGWVRETLRPPGDGRNGS